MANIPYIGQHCSFVNCKRLDFLPFKCDEGCKQTFCLDHRSPDSHDCAHKFNTNVVKEPSLIPNYECSVQKCSRKEVTPITCHDCQKNFCLSHRHQVDHSCEDYRPKITKKVNKRISVPVNSSVERKTNQGRKSKTLEAKVQLMKMKQNPKEVRGNIGVISSERVHLNVLPPLCLQNRKNKFMFFQKKWSISRALTVMANHYNLTVENAECCSHGASVLGLFDISDGHRYDCDEYFEKLLSDDGELVDGCSVILEYYDENESFISSPQCYKL